jgi:hypothetical protein
MALSLPELVKHIAEGIATRKQRQIFDQNIDVHWPCEETKARLAQNEAIRHFATENGWAVIIRPPRRSITFRALESPEPSS